MEDGTMTVDSPYLLRRLDINQAGLRNKMLLGDINGDGRMEIVMVQPDGGIDDRYVPHQVQCLTAYDLEGKLLWQVGTPDPSCGGPGSDYPAQIYDIDGDGCNEVLCVMDKRFLVLDGRTGETKRSFELPDYYAHDCLIIANLSGGEHAREVILKDRYRTLWAMDHDFGLLWKYEGNPGHYPWVYDIDGDGRDEVMAGYDMLDHDGTKLWSCRELEDHADCVWFGDVDGDSAGSEEIVIGGSVTVMYDRQGNERWRYEGSIESQHVALGKFRDDLPGLQVAGLDRIVRGDTSDVLTESGKDGLFLLDREGQELWKEDRKTNGWLTIIETLRNYDEGPLDYILAYRRGGGVNPTLYDGHMNAVVTFPVDGYVTHADLTGEGREQVLIYQDSVVHIFGSQESTLQAVKPGVTLQQPKRLYSSTLYPGGEYRA
jgi:outer membrane protein assembly factor BamB